MGFSLAEQAGLPNHSTCTGCGACQNICKFEALALSEDKEDFLYPQLDPDKCTECMQCSKVCPVNHSNNKNNHKPLVYAVRGTDEVRSYSSSGGVFTLLSEAVFQMGGYVCGAAFDEDMMLRHILVNDRDQLGSLRGSKYLQSNTEMVFRDIKELLLANIPVLFTGCPCQVAGLYNFLGKRYENLYTADILCHGVPSQRTFLRYLDEISAGREPIKVDFRNKLFGWSCETICAEFSDGSSYKKSRREGDHFVKGFLSNLFLRKSCEYCPFCEFPREGDISLGDFWGISGINPKLNDSKGTSMIFVNNKKGELLFDKIKESCLSIDKIPFTPEKFPNRIWKEYLHNKNRKRFFQFIERMPMSAAVEKALSNKYDIGLVSNFYAGNFGGSLTQYALYSVLEEMGYSTLMIERPLSARDRGKTIAKIMDRIYIKRPYSENCISPQYPTRMAMSALNSICDTFIVGSDQLFQYDLFNDLDRMVQLDWVLDTKKKIAYAASYGHSYLWGDPDILAEMGYFLRKFDSFSVRESTGVTLTKEYFSVDAQWVLDPVFLCNISDYKKLTSVVNRKIDKNYISCYILDPSEDKKNIIKEAMTHLNLTCEVVSELSHSKEYEAPLNGLNVKHLKIEERLHSIENCDFYIGDSFHGMCFAIIMKKPFIAIENVDRGASRFRPILEHLNLSHRLISSFNDLKDRNDIFDPIDYDAVYAILDRDKSFSFDWLKKALSSDKQKSMSDYDIFMRKLQEQDTQIRVLDDKCNNLKKRLLALRTSSPLHQQLINISSIGQYIDFLKDNQKYYDVIFCVKDTPGFHITPIICEKLKELGIKSNLRDKHWHSFVSILSGRKQVFEKLSKEYEEVEYKCNLNKNQIDVVSKSFKSGNISIIKVNGLEYSVNKRGLNIVIIDKKSNIVVDSVCFDTHTSHHTCYREI